MNGILIVCVIIIIIGISCSVYNNEYTDWKTKKEVDKYFQNKFSK